MTLVIVEASTGRVLRKDQKKRYLPKATITLPKSS